MTVTIKRLPDQSISRQAVRVGALAVLVAEVVAVAVQEAVAVREVLAVLAAADAAVVRKISCYFRVIRG